MDMLQTYQFSSLTGTNTPVGPYRWGIMDMSINGNHRPGGRCIAIYGYNYIIQDVEFYNSPADGCYSEWCLSGLVPVVAGGESMEANFTRVTFYGNGGNGLTFNGPHDTVFTEILTFLNTGRGATFGQTTSYIGSSVIIGMHSYGNQQVGVQFDTGMYATQLQSENNRSTGGIYISSPNGQLNGTNVIVFENTGFGISIAGATSTIASMFVYDNSSDGIVISGLNNTLSTISTTSSTGGNGLVLSSGSNGTVINGIIAAQNHFAGIAIGSSDVQINGVFVEFNQQSGVAFTNGLSSVSLSGQLNNNTGDQVAFNTLGNNCIIDLQIFTVSPQVAWAGIVGTNFTRISAIGYDVRSLQSGPVGQTNGPVNVLNYGATGNGITDDSAAINAALATGFTVYIPKTTASYLIKNPINCTHKGQLIYGDGRDATIITVNSTFNLASAGVFIFSSGEQGPILKDFNITFTQPDTTNRASLTAYPPAIYAPTQPRFQLIRLAIWRCMVAVSMPGNSGGAYLQDLQISAFTAAVEIDGCVDTVRCQSLHIWPFSLTANQSTIFYNTNTLGIASARCDDLVLSDCLFLCGTQLKLYQSSNGNTFGSATNCGFDSYNGILMSAGNFSVNGGYFSIAVAGVPGIYNTGGILRVTGADFQNSNSTSFPMADMDLSATAADIGYLGLSNCTFSSGSADVSAVQINGHNNSQTLLDMTNCYFSKAPNTNYTLPVVNVLGAFTRITMMGCRIEDKGTGSGSWITIQDDNWNAVVGNVGPGWTNSAPTATNAIYANNNPVV